MSPGKKKADIWTLVTFAGFAIVIVFLIFPLFDVFKIQFSGQGKQKCLLFPIGRNSFPGPIT